MIGYSEQHYKVLSKGCCHGHQKASRYDQITRSFGKNGTGNCQANPAALFRSSFPSRFYTIPAIRHYGFATVLQNGLSRDNPDTSGLLGFKKHPGLKQAAAFYNCSKGAEQVTKKNVFTGLLGKIFECLIKTAKSGNLCSADSTGLENHYVSRHFIMRRNSRTDKYRRWTKLLIIIDNFNHLIGSATVSKGPSTDCHQLKESLEMAVDNIPVKNLLADSGFDSEYNHQLCREQLGINSIIPVNDRNLKYGQTRGFFRRKMKLHFANKKYRQRWQVESVFSRLKRRLGAYLTARQDWSRTAECYLRVLTYDLMILYLLFKRAIFLNVFYRAFLYLICFSAPPPSTF
jgi:hypothetical protein